MINPDSIVRHLGAVVTWPVPWDEWERPLYIGFRTQQSRDSYAINMLAVFQVRDMFEPILMYGIRPLTSLLEMSQVADLYFHYLTMFPTMRPVYRMIKARDNASNGSLSFLFYNMKGDDIWEKAFYL